MSSEDDSCGPTGRRRRRRAEVPLPDAFETLLLKRLGWSVIRRPSFSLPRISGVRLASRLVRLLLEANQHVALGILFSLLNWEDMALLWLALPDLDLVGQMTETSKSIVLWRNTKPLLRALDYYALDADPFFRVTVASQEGSNHLPGRGLSDLQLYHSDCLNWRSFYKAWLDLSTDFSNLQTLTECYFPFRDDGSASFAQALFNPKHNLVAHLSCDRRDNWTLRVATFGKNRSVNSRVLYEEYGRKFETDPTYGRICHEWSSEGSHLMVLASAGKKARISLYRYAGGVLRKLENLPGGLSYIECDAALAGTHLWLDDHSIFIPASRENWFVLHMPHKTALYRTPVTPVESTRPSPTELPKKLRKLPSPIPGCCTALPSLQAFAYLHECPLEGHYHHRLFVRSATTRGAEIEDIPLATVDLPGFVTAIAADESHLLLMLRPHMVQLHVNQIRVFLYDAKTLWCKRSIRAARHQLYGCSFSQATFSAAERTDTLVSLRLNADFALNTYSNIRSLPSLTTWRHEAEHCLFDRGAEQADDVNRNYIAILKNRVLLRSNSNWIFVETISDETFVLNAFHKYHMIARPHLGCNLPHTHPRKPLFLSYHPGSSGRYSLKASDTLEDSDYAFANSPVPSFNKCIQMQTMQLLT